MSVTFRTEDEAYSVVIDGYNFPFGLPSRTGQVNARTQGGVDSREKLAAPSAVRIFTWDRLSESEVEALRVFLITRINGGLDAFDFLDVDAVWHTAYWMDVDYLPTAQTPLRWTVTLTLRFTT